MEVVGMEVVGDELVPGVDEVTGGGVIGGGGTIRHLGESPELSHASGYGH
ncbi:hypothetical protein SAMD00019534_102890 [Acytostelium subglobosum LB1]|nr:hypothetical protein SAMD00019534_102890 [Acytostelium subglobosum LB1]GAM27114.1 hypothetical protein SAMD00019534_102890 [Acytostelium subglobosum LB1]|eukprot:XP_012749994.1 hypothetical protein SAMD00019534_102890 [Acytostelium subglobosum LB1]